LLQTPKRSATIPVLNFLLLTRSLRVNTCFAIGCAALCCYGLAPKHAHPLSGRCAPSSSRQDGRRNRRCEGGLQGAVKREIFAWLAVDWTPSRVSDCAAAQAMNAVRIIGPSGLDQ
jgi:hypothetical protein